MQQATAALSTTLIDMGNFCSDMLKLWLKLHEATQNAPVRLPEYPLAYKLVVAIGRLRDVFKTTIVSVSETMSKSDKMREPLLQSPQQASMTEANGDR